MDRTVAGTYGLEQEETEPDKLGWRLYCHPGMTVHNCRPNGTVISARSGL